MDLEPALGELFAQGDDPLCVQDELLLLRREIEGLDVEEARVGGCDLGDLSGDIDLVDPLVVGRPSLVSTRILTRMAHDGRARTHGLVGKWAAVDLPGCAPYLYRYASTDPAPMMGSKIQA